MIRYSEETLLIYVSEGRKTLQVPTVSIDISREGSMRISEDVPETYPVSWFDFLHVNRGKHEPVIFPTRKQYFTFISEEGYRANYQRLRSAFEFSLVNGWDRGHTWNDFEEMAEEHFLQLRTLGYSKVRI